MGLALVGCATPRVSKLTDEQPKFATEEDEVELLREADSMYLDLQEEGMVHPNEEIRAYLQAVGDSLAPPAATSHVKLDFVLLRDPVPNAFSLPNGRILVTLGLFNNLENEAELAFVLAHEIAHVVSRDSLTSQRKKSSNIIAAHVADLMLLGTSIAYLPALSSYASYSREQELSADHQAVLWVSQQGYDAERAMNGLAAVSRGLPARKKAGSGGMMASHPTDLARQDAFRKMVADDPTLKREPGRMETEKLAAFQQGLYGEHIDLLLHCGLYRFARNVAERRIEKFPDTADHHAWLGETWRLQAEDPVGTALEQAGYDGVKCNRARVDQVRAETERSRDAAERAFRKALELNPTQATAQRGLGLLLVGRGIKPQGSELLQAYLAGNATASDRRYIQYVLKEVTP